MAKSDIALTASIDFTQADTEVNKFVERAKKKMSEIMASASGPGGSLGGRIGGGGGGGGRGGAARGLRAIAPSIVSDNATSLLSSYFRDTKMIVAAGEARLKEEARLDRKKVALDAQRIRLTFQAGRGMSNALAKTERDQITAIGRQARLVINSKKLELRALEKINKDEIALIGRQAKLVLNSKRAERLALEKESRERFRIMRGVNNIVARGVMSEVRDQNATDKMVAADNREQAKRKRASVLSQIKDQDATDRMIAAANRQEVARTRASILAKVKDQQATDKMILAENREETRKARVAMLERIKDQEATDKMILADNREQSRRKRASVLSQIKDQDANDKMIAAANREEAQKKRMAMLERIRDQDATDKMILADNREQARRKKAAIISDAKDQAATDKMVVAANRAEARERRASLLEKIRDQEATDKMVSAQNKRDRDAIASKVKDQNATDKMVQQENRRARDAIAAKIKDQNATDRMVTQQTRASIVSWMKEKTATDKMIQQENRRERDAIAMKAKDQQATDRMLAAENKRERATIASKIKDQQATDRMQVMFERLTTSKEKGNIRSIGTASNMALGQNLRIDRQLGDNPQLQTRLYKQVDMALKTYVETIKTYGSRSIEATRASIEFNRQMKLVNGDIAKSGGLLANLNKNFQNLGRGFGELSIAGQGLTRFIYNTGVALSALSAAFGFRQLLDANLAMETFTNTLRATADSPTEFANNLAFVKKVANDVGVSLESIATPFARYSTSAKSAGLATYQIQETFTQLVAATRNFGLSASDTQGVVRALEQSLSKGRFTAEEVRNQLGDRMPNAMRALQIATGKTGAELDKMMTAGLVTTQEFFLPFVKALYDLSGGQEALTRTSQSMGAAINRLGNAFFLAADKIGQNGFNKAVKESADSIRELLNSSEGQAFLVRLGQAAETAGNGFKFLIENIDTVGYALAALVGSSVIKGLAAFIATLSRMNPYLLAIQAAAVGVASALVGLRSAAVKAEEDLQRVNEAKELLSKPVSPFINPQEAERQTRLFQEMLDRAKAAKKAAEAMNFSTNPMGDPTGFDPSTQIAEIQKYDQEIAALTERLQALKTEEQRTTEAAIAALESRRKTIVDNIDQINKAVARDGLRGIEIHPETVSELGRLSEILTQIDNQLNSLRRPVRVSIEVEAQALVDGNNAVPDVSRVWKAKEARDRAEAALQDLNDRMGVTPRQKRMEKEIEQSNRLYKAEITSLRNNYADEKRIKEAEADMLRAADAIRKRYDTSEQDLAKKSKAYDAIANSIESLNDRMERAIQGVDLAEADSPVRRLIALTSATADYSREIGEIEGKIKSSKVSEEQRGELQKKLGVLYANSTKAVDTYLKGVSRLKEVYAEDALALRNRAVALEDTIRAQEIELSGAFDADKQIAELTRQREQESLALERGIELRRLNIGLIEAEESKNKDLADVIRAQITEVSSLYDRIAQGIDTKATQTANRRIYQDSKQLTDDIVNDFTNRTNEMLQGNLDSWKDFFTGIADFAKQMFVKIAADAIIRPIIQPVVTNAVNAMYGAVGMGPNAAPGSAGGSNFMSNIFSSTPGGSMFGSNNAVSSFLNKPLFNLTSGGAPTTAVSGSGAHLASLDGLAGGSPQAFTAGNALGAAGFGFNSFRNFKNGNAVGGIGNAAAAAMMFIPGAQPFAPFVALGSEMLGGMFGAGKRGDPYVQGQISLQDGKLVGNAAGDNMADPSETQAQIDAAIKGLTDAASARGLVFTKGADGLFGDRTDKTLEQAIDEIVSGIRAGTGASKTVSAVVNKGGFTNMDQLNEALGRADNFDALTTTLKEMWDVTNDAEQQLQQLANTMDEAKKFADEFGLSLTDVTKEMAGDFDTQIRRSILGLTDPFTLAMEDFGRTAASRLEMARRLGADIVQVERLNALERAEILDQYTGTGTGTSTKTKTKAEQISDAQEALVDAYERERDKYQDLVDTFKDIAKSLKDFRQGLLLDSTLSPLSPEAKLEEARRQFRETAAKAAAGDVTAMGELQGASQSYLEASKDYYASSEDYFRTFQEVSGVLESTETLAEREMKVAEQQLDVMKRQMDYLGLLNENIVSFTDAMKSYLGLTGKTIPANIISGGAAVDPRPIGAHGVAQSGEFLYGGSVTAGEALNASNVNALYRQFLGRDAEAGVAEQWMAYGGRGFDLANALEATPEFQARLKQVRGYAAGGWVGNGTWNKDSVLAAYAGGGNIALAGGEYVVRAPAASAYANILPQINAGTFPMAGGGEDDGELLAAVKQLVSVTAMSGKVITEAVCEGNKSKAEMTSAARRNAAAPAN